MVVWAVKPRQLQAAALPRAEYVQDALQLSIAAGIPCAALANAEPLEQLRARVTPRGRTTSAALEHMAQAGLDRIVGAAALRAHRQAGMLADELAAGS